jgi:checkpoint serine/threonine-protein kinase
LRQKLRRFAEGQPIHKKIIPNQRDGKLECVFVNLEAVYPNENDQTEEYCFEELRAANRGWLDRDWAAERAREVKQKAESRARVIVQQPRPPLTDIEPHANVPAEPSPAEQAANDLAESIEQSLLINDENAPPPATSQEPKLQKMQIFADENAPPTISRKPKVQKMQIFADENEEVAPKVAPSKAKSIPLNDENAQSSGPVDREAEIARRLRREERANKTRKIKVREVKRDDQTSE